ncbi:hypothetical protein J2X72_001168 [Phyllobacterium sp. 1468]|uniref:hypothetical protein n=1 Tax=Phyllobacterium sp. 1468 TaxID=2817759 RepID=UPI002856A406|nr:hypothetical protein [Phyllobacterium sp. 1468]MDR6632384.1 hypothetical protein [Phyllobacterium sp. 1468]
MGVIGALQGSPNSVVGLFEQAGFDVLQSFFAGREALDASQFSGDANLLRIHLRP